jgi:hypothetical protein
MSYMNRSPMSLHRLTLLTHGNKARSPSLSRCGFVGRLPLSSCRLSTASEVTSALEDNLLRFLAAYPGFLAPQGLTDDVDGS